MAANLDIVIRAVDQLSGPLSDISDKMKNMGRRMQSTGVQAIALGGAMAAPAIAALKMASDFEDSLVNIAALTNTPADAVEHLREEILEMAKVIPKSPSELGAAAYFILSSGVDDVNKAMAILEMSAKASSAGLGETKIIADALTSVMNAYGLSADEASFATDTLVNIVKLGKGEPEDLAASLGHVIPIAAQMGVEFQQVGAVLATLTNTGLDAAESVTAIRGIMNQILSPTEAATKKFAELGLPLVEFRKMVDADFVRAMQRLMDATGGSEETLALLFPEIRGLTGVMAAFGNQADQTASNLEQINAGLGATDKAFATASESASFKFKAAVNSVNVAMIKFGAQALPIVVKVIEGVSVLANKFAGLPAPLQKLIIVGTLLAAGFLVVVGTAAVLAGSLLILAAAFTTTWIAATAGLILVIPALIAIGVAAYLFRDQIADVLNSVLSFVQGHQTEIAAIIAILFPFAIPLLLAYKFRDEIMAVFNTVRNFIQGHQAEVAAIIAVLFPFIIPLAAAFKFRDDIAGVFNAVKDVVLDLLSFVSGAMNQVGESVTAPLRTVQSVVRTLIQWFERLIDTINSIPSPGDIVPNLPGVPDVNPFRAMGGPVQRGLSYIVGERGPEPFIPSTNGTILPNSALLGAATAGGTIAINIYATPNQSARDIALCVREELRNLQRRGR